MKNIIIKLRENEDRSIIFKMPGCGRLDMKLALHPLKKGMFNVTWGIKRLKESINGVIKEDKKYIWLTTLNKELNNCTPLEKILEGEKGMKEVIELLNNIGWGIPT